MWVQATHHLTDHTSTFYVSSIRAQTHLAHLEQNSTLHWLQAIAGIG
jgi:hypothetical protein